MQRFDRSIESPYLAGTDQTLQSYSTPCNQLPNMSSVFIPLWVLVLIVISMSLATLTNIQHYNTNVMSLGYLQVSRVPWAKS